MEENIVVIRKLKNFYFDFDLLKDFNMSLKHEIEFIIKHNECLAEKNPQKTKTKTRLNNY